jgi:IS1 family transposase
MIVWMGLALMVSTRLWLGGVVSLKRDTCLADRLLRQVRACSQAMCAVLVATDGWNAYPKAIMRAFRDKVKRTLGRGRACLQVWPQLCIATVIKHTQKKRVVEVTRKMTLGTLAQASHLLQASRGGTMLNTAFIERFNGTMRERLATLTRKCRHAAMRLMALEAGMYLIGCTYNFCRPHQELSSRRHIGHPCTPAMAAGLTDHIWSVAELLMYKVAPSPWVAPKRRPRIRPLPDPAMPKRPRGRPRKVA